jgi:hypothetical protein
LDLHRSPQLAAPTLLVVGEVVRMADPAALVEGFAMPDVSKGNDGLRPPAFSKHFYRRRRAWEQIQIKEPVA